MESAGSVYRRADQTDAPSAGKTKTKIRKLCSTMPQMAMGFTYLPRLIMCYDHDQKPEPQLILQEILSHTFYLFWMLATAFAYCTSYYFKKKEEKSETDFHKLRCEIIQKSTDLWPQPDKWKARESVFHMMKHKYDINLYFESK
ncbi:YpbF [Bacillus subtilis]|nr:YpbF family protein [Bacillus subtilis]WGE05569.1 YpbF family protein [Bacillus subtilis]SPU03351.1 YpbF [Bacillus subtilis]